MPQKASCRKKLLAVTEPLIVSDFRRTRTYVTYGCNRGHGDNRFTTCSFVLEGCFVVLRLDYLSCVLTIISTILVGKRCWEGWILAGINSAIICVIGLRTAQFGFVPANLFCIVLYGVNLRAWRRTETS